MGKIKSYHANATFWTEENTRLSYQSTMTPGGEGGKNSFSLGQQNPLVGLWTSLMFIDKVLSSVENWPPTLKLNVKLIFLRTLSIWCFRLFWRTIRSCRSPYSSPFSGSSRTRKCQRQKIKRLKRSWHCFGTTTEGRLFGRRAAHCRDANLTRRFCVDL